MTFPTVLGGGPRSTAGGPVDTLSMPIPAATYADSDLLVAFVVCATHASGGVSSAVYAGTGSPWTPFNGGFALGEAHRLYSADPSDLVALSPDGSVASVAGSGHVMAFRGADINRGVLAGGGQYLPPNPGSQLMHATSFFDTTLPADALGYLTIGASLEHDGGSVDLAPDVTWTAPTSAFGTWVEIASAAGTAHRLYELAGGLPAGSTWTTLTDIATTTATTPYVGPSNSVFLDIWFFTITSSVSVLTECPPHLAAVASSGPTRLSTESPVIVRGQRQAAIPSLTARPF